MNNHIMADTQRKQILVLRHHFIKSIREFFVNKNDFIEVETPLLVKNPGLEPHLEYFQTEYRPSMGGEAPQTYYLPTSPEYHLKKALAEGLPRIFEITRSFRNGELSRRHQPEFAMLEWYRHPASYREIAQDVQNLFVEVAALFSASPKHWSDVRHFTVLEAFEEFCGLALDLILRNGEQESLARRAREAGFKQVSETADFEEAFNHLVVDVIERKFEEFHVCFLWDYPLEMAALSKRKKDRPYLCERFEVYFKGLELANAFGELTDAKEQRKRCLTDQAERTRLYNAPAPPLDEEFLSSLEHLSEAGGIALGLDRLLQALVGSDSLEKVLAFPKKTDS
jgi:elongation factor P--(R)-beta-lysine ligase